MPKQIVIEVPDWVDEDTIKEIIQREISVKKESENKLKKLEKLLDELPKRELDFNKLKELYYEAKMLD
ncbi:hypothetical protein DRP05_14765 [Archaeoglobales archaeon]|nr:MAG: hypothetical protein DRP05_14765 [Archaeoglobales archaeon]